MRFGGVGEPVGPVDVGGDGTLGKQLDEIGEILSEPVRVVRDDPSRDIVTISGNLTDDPELKYTPAALWPTSHGRDRPRARRRDLAQWQHQLLRVNCWRQLAEHVTDSLAKGDCTMIVGWLRSRS